MSQSPVNPDRRPPPSTIIILIILHITGNGFGGHTSSVEYWLQQL
jgi:hypothetical protein